MFLENILKPKWTKEISLAFIKLKKEGILRFCVDYRTINTVSGRDLYSSPRMDKWINLLKDVDILSTLETNGKNQ